MRITFDTTQDFDASYDLPGYGCTVHVEVMDGIVCLSVEDDDWAKDEDDDDLDDWLDTDIEDLDDDEYEEVETEQEEEEESSVEEETEETTEEPTEAEKTEDVDKNSFEYRFVKSVAKADKDGTLLKMLDSFVSNKGVRAFSNKADRMSVV